MSSLPTGAVTFLFTDVEGSTRLLHDPGVEEYARALAEHRRIVRDACAVNGGVEVDTQGDAFFVAFPTAPGALAAAAEITQALESGPIRVRMGLHTGTALLTEDQYVGADVLRAARIAAAGYGGQVLVSASTVALLGPGDRSAEGISLVDLGEHRLKDFEGSVQILQLGEGSFPPLKTISNTNLPRPELFRRSRARAVRGGRPHRGRRAYPHPHRPGRLGQDSACDRGRSVGRPRVQRGRLLGRARLAPRPGARHRHDRAGARCEGRPRRAHRRAEDAPPAGQPGAGHRGRARALAFGRRLPEPGSPDHEPRAPPRAGRGRVCGASLAEAEAVSLFCERAELEPSEEIAALCARLDNLPLAVELAAARAKAFTPGQIVERLSQRLDLLTSGRDADPRQQTLRATIEWSYDLLSDDQRALFSRLSVFAGGCTLEAAETVIGADLDTLQSLVEKSLLGFSNERYGMLETIREFAAEWLDPREADTMQRRHRAYMVALAEASAGNLHTAREGAESARLAPEYANFRATVSYALAADEPDDVGRILGALYPFLISYGHLAESHEWADAALGARARLSNAGLAETLVGGGEIARFAGDLSRAIELKEELASVQADPKRPNWKAATLADLCEIALERRDYASARGYAEGSAAAGGGARAELCFAELALRIGDLHSAEAHGFAALADLEEGAFNHATALELLAESARRSGDRRRAREQFQEALRSFAALKDAGGAADCLDGLGRLAAEGGHLERAGRLFGAAQHMRDVRGRIPIRSDLPLPDVPEGAHARGGAMTFAEAVEYGLTPIH